MSGPPPKAIAAVEAVAVPVVHAQAIPVDWKPSFYMEDWGEEKRRRFERLAVEMDWGLASIQVSYMSLSSPCACLPL